MCVNGVAYRFVGGAVALRESCLLFFGEEVGLCGVAGEAGVDDLVLVAEGVGTLLDLGGLEELGQHDERRRIIF